MADRTEVILVTGFLGSGKTTFVNRLLEAVPPGCKVLVLVNEFGEIGLDGALLQGDGHEVLEVSKGSIFCICVKRDFIRALHTAASDIRPDLLLMEATGVANPADLRKDLQLPLFGNRFHLREQVCVVDAENFAAAFPVFASVEQQIATSTLFLVNKVDAVPRAQVEQVKEMIRAHHPSPRFVETVQCRMPLDHLLETCRRLREERADVPPAAPTRLLPEDLEAIVSGLGLDPFRKLTPPDRLVSAAFVWAGGEPGEFRRLAAELPRGVVRGKGFLMDGDRPCLMSLVMGNVTLEAAPADVSPRLLNKLVLIFPPELQTALDEVVGRWTPRFARLPAAPAGCV